MNENRKFTFHNREETFTITDLWKQKYSNIWNMQDVIAEFIIEKALGINKSINTDYWTLYDILYREKRIEIKETGYYHPWNEGKDVSKQRTFGITKANSDYEEENKGNNKYERQNDIYVFCLNIGETKESSDPMNLDNWEFYIVPTKIINEYCTNNKTISLGIVKKLSVMYSYDKIKGEIDRLIDNNLI